MNNQENLTLNKKDNHLDANTDTTKMLQLSNKVPEKERKESRAQKVPEKAVAKKSKI